MIVEYKKEASRQELIERIEELKKEIEELNKIIEINKENWFLAQNELLGYAQGYEDGKKHRQTATAMVVENRKYQIIREEIERYRDIIEKQRKEIIELKKEHGIMKRIIVDNGLWETLLNDDEFVNYLEENNNEYL